jgi:hypothetical protein
LYLDWSLQAQREGTTQFSVNGQAVPKGSAEEADWLRLIREAITPLQSEGASPSLPASNATAAAPEGPAFKGLMLLPAGDAAYFDAIAQGPEAALRALAGRLVDHVSSAAYQHFVPPPAPLSDQEVIGPLMARGRRVEAMRVYRQRHPHASPREAKDAVEAAMSMIAGDHRDVAPGG